MVALGGLNESGKNCYCLEVDGDIFVIECGLKYPAADNPGVDYLIPNFDYLRRNSSRVKAVIITHGHDSQYGALPYLLNLINVPVYASSTTINMIRMDYGRKFRRFGTYRFVSVVPSSTVTIAGHVFQFFQTTHSMPNSFGFSLKTSAGNIVYTSDFISDYNHSGNFSFDMPRMCQIAQADKTLLLMCESESAQLPGTASPNHRLAPHIESAFEEAKGPVYIALYTQNFFNIQEVIDTAVKADKVVTFYTPEMTDFLKSFNASGDLVIPTGHYVPFTDIKSVPENQRVVIITGSGLKLFSDIKELAYGARKAEGFGLGVGDTFIMACPSVPGIEVQHTEALDTVFATGAKVLNITRRDIAAMHAQQEDIKMMITLFHPKYYMPVKGEFRQLMANARTAVDMDIGLNHRNIFVYDNGMFIKFDDKGEFIPVPEKVLANDVVVDGATVGEVKDNVLEERATMSSDGVILMGALVSLKNKVQLSTPDIQMRGFIYLKDSTKLVDNVNAIFSATVDSLLKSEKPVALAEIQHKASEKISRFLKKETDKQPIVICVIRNADEAQRSLEQRHKAHENRTPGSKNFFHPRRPQLNRSPAPAPVASQVPNVKIDLPSPRKPVVTTPADTEEKK